MAEAISNAEPQDAQQRKETLAVLEGHDADLPTEDQASKATPHQHSSKSPVSAQTLKPDTEAPHEALPADDAAEKETLTAHKDDGTLSNEKAIESSGLAKEVDLEAGRSSDSTADKKEADVSEKPAVPVDPNVVDWDGPDDPENPINWPTGKKWTNISIMAAITFLTYVVSLLLIA